MNALEKRTALVVVVVFGLRMLGLFSLMPVLSVLALDLRGASVLLVGLSVGIYGLTQCVFQMPMGWLSDHFGRKPVIVGGLLVFALGSLLAAWSDTIWGVLLGRALQGAGAIASALLALVTDAARPEYRTRLMAMVGASIGLAFSLAFVLGPQFGAWWGLSGLFYFGLLCALSGIAVVQFGLPQLPRITQAPVALRLAFRQTFATPDLARLAATVLILHALMTSLFVVLPIAMTQSSLTLSQHTGFYLPCVLIAFVLVIPPIFWSERKKRIKPVLMLAALLLAAGILVLAAAQGLLWVAVGFTVFFTGFNILEASLPSTMGKAAPEAVRGLAMGFFSSAQFLGAFVGGVLGGLSLKLFSPGGAFVLLSGVAAIAFRIVSGIQTDRLALNQPRLSAL